MGLWTFTKLCTLQLTNRAGLVCFIDYFTWFLVFMHFTGYKKTEKGKIPRFKITDDYVGKGLEHIYLNHQVTYIFEALSTDNILPKEVLSYK